MNTRCQSCGMPLNQDPEGGGNEVGGLKSAKYCSYCYENGEFKQPDWTAQQMQDFVSRKLQEKGYPKIVAWFFSRGIPRLDRWR